MVSRGHHTRRPGCLSAARRHHGGDRRQPIRFATQMNMWHVGRRIEHMRMSGSQLTEPLLRRVWIKQRVRSGSGLSVLHDGSVAAGLVKYGQSNAIMIDRRGRGTMMHNISDRLTNLVPIKSLRVEQIVTGRLCLQLDCWIIEVVIGFGALIIVTVYKEAFVFDIQQITLLAPIALKLLLIVSNSDHSSSHYRRPHIVTWINVWLCPRTAIDATVSQIVWVGKTCLRNGTLIGWWVLFGIVVVLVILLIKPQWLNCAFKPPRVLSWFRRPVQAFQSLSLKSFQNKPFNNILNQKYFDL